ncbi:MAG: DGQHR domain-containing protein [Sandaracinaceae bacterium]|nr:DGQHR domain-containing protein [Sandaracinaceae bacterium]
MLTVPAVKVQQFQQDLYLLNLAAGDVERLVRFEVLGETGLNGGKVRKGKASLVNWSEIEKKVSTSEKAFQRPLLRKKIEELANHYRQCREDGAVPAIPGAVLLTSEEPVTFAAQGANPFVGLLQMSEAEGSLRVLDGQHRLLALAALLSTPDEAAMRTLQVPAILFAGLPAPSIVEMFVTINSKHTRLNPSLLYSLKGRQLYPDPIDSAIHDAIKRLNEKDGSPLEGHIKMLGVGRGKVPQAGLAQELRAAIESVRSAQVGSTWTDDFVEHLYRFYDLYFREAQRTFADAWTSKRHSVRSTIALRAFIQASPPVVARVYAVGGDPRPVVRAMLDPWSTRIGSARFETAGAWRAKAAGGGKETSRLLARELVAALGVMGA